MLSRVWGRSGMARVAPSLAARVLALFAVTALAPLVVALAQINYGISEAEQRALEQSRTIARAGAVEMEQLIGEARSVARTLERLPAFWSGSDEDRDLMLAAFASPQSVFNGLFFVTPDLQEHGASNHTPERIRLDASGRAYAREAISTGRLAVTDEPLRALSNNATVLPVAIPLRASPQGGQEGLLVAGIMLDRLTRLWEELPLPDGSGAMLVDTRQGRVIAGAGVASGRLEQPLAEASLARIRAGETTFHARSADSIEYLRLWAPVAETPWILVVDIPDQQVLAPIYAEAAARAVPSVVVASTAMVLLLVLWRRLAARLGQLGAAAKYWGHGDWSFRTGLQGGDELDRLGAAFDHMAEQLGVMVRQNESILRSAGEGIYGMDLEGRLTFANPAAAEMLGRDAQSMVGRASHEMVCGSDPDAPHEARCSILATMLDGTTQRGRSAVFQRGDGTSFPVEYTSTPMREEQGRVVGAVVTFRDITDRLRAEQERVELAREQAARVEAETGRQRFAFLAEASRQLASSLDYSATLASVARLAVPTLADYCVIDVIEENGRIQRVEVAHADPAKEVLAQELRRFPPDPAAGFGAAAVLRTGEAQLISEVPESYLVAVARDPEHLRIVRSLGLTSTMLVPLVARGRTLGVIRFAASESGRRYGLEDLDLGEDLARRCALAIDNARLYREAQRAIGARDEFLSVAAHELKTPLTSLRGFGQLLQRRLERNGLMETEWLRRGFEVMDQQTGKLGLLISQLLDLTRLEGGRLTLERRPTDVAALVEGLAEGLRTWAGNRKLEVYTGGRVMADVDSLRLEQVVSNLLDNAVKFSPEGSTITVEASLDASGQVQIIVADQGIGVPPEHRPHIFDRFYQAHQDSHLSGMGLGLHISRQIIELHGGSIEAQFPPGGGTRFVISLPAAPYESVESAPAEALDGKSGG